jgi:hypothetical protein
MKSYIRFFVSAVTYGFDGLFCVYVQLSDRVLKFMHGYRNREAALKKEGLMSVHEGTNYISFNTYCALSKRMLSCTLGSNKNPQRGSLFGFIYGILAWNTIQRNETIASIMLEHLKMGGDCISVSVFATKSLQDAGRDIHLYANPYKPWICPILALALLVFGGELVGATGTYVCRSV